MWSLFARLMATVCASLIIVLIFVALLYGVAWFGINLGLLFGGILV